MLLNLGSFAFNIPMKDGANTPAWGTEMGQGTDYKFDFEDMSNFFTALVYNSIEDSRTRVFCPLGKGGKKQGDYQYKVASVFHKIYVNEIFVPNAKFVLLVVKLLNGNNHVGRCTLKYNVKMTLDDEEINQECVNLIAETLGISSEAAWFVDEINLLHQDELHFKVHILDERAPITFDTPKERTQVLAAYRNKGSHISKEKHTLTPETIESAKGQNYADLHTALRTKPFMLLAGISGTGKSRIVKEMAFHTCPDVSDLQKDKIAPGNYQLIEVKPNWHDSSELLGYESALKNTYVVTPFVKFLCKAMMHPDVPFFVCLDEMNLAPVEQYFAEFLSVLESRKKKDDVISSEPLIEAKIFNRYELLHELFEIEDEQTNPKGYMTTEESVHYGNENPIYNRLKEEGLRIPSNLIVIGTVNMDETTHQFSRKVIDRAMTIEMNEVNFKSFFTESTELDYLPEPLDAGLFLSQNVSAKEAMDKLQTEEEKEYLRNNVPQVLDAINEALDGTPFKVAYRVQNELVIYYCELRHSNADETNEKLLATAVDDILMMKVLPRIEGDKDVLETPLKNLSKLAADNSCEKAKKKLKEMTDRLDNSPFTSFWP